MIYSFWASHRLFIFPSDVDFCTNDQKCSDLFFAHWEPSGHAVFVYSVVFITKWFVSMLQFAQCRVNADFYDVIFFNMSFTNTSASAIWMMFESSLRLLSHIIATIWNWGKYSTILCVFARCCFCLPYYLWCRFR